MNEPRSVVIQNHLINLDLALNDLQWLHENFEYADGVSQSEIQERINEATRSHSEISAILKQEAL